MIPTSEASTWRELCFKNGDPVPVYQRFRAWSHRAGGRAKMRTLLAVSSNKRRKRSHLVVDHDVGCWGVRVTLVIEGPAADTLGP